MSSNICHLTYAIWQALVSNQCLVDYTCHGTETNVATGEPSIGIYESEPNTLSNPPAIVIDVMGSEPLVRDCNTGCHEAMVAIYAIDCIDNGSRGATYLADQLQCMFDTPPEGESRQKWFYDLSTECITNKYTKYMNRIRKGKDGISMTNHETDTWTSGIMLEVQWCECGCDGIRCEDEIPEKCPIENTQLEYNHPDCFCDG